MVWTMQIRECVKDLLQVSLPTRRPPIIVASMGRSGSTIVWNAVAQAVATDRFKSLGHLGIKIVSDQAWDLGKKKLLPGIVYKTHALADEFPRDSGAKVVFLFGSATDAALSVLSCERRYGLDWVKEHFMHVRASGPFEALGEYDVLRFGEQIEGWVGLSGVPRLILHYDALWEHQSTLSKFVGAPIELPRRQPRVGPSAANANTRARFALAYRDLDERINRMQKCQILS